MFCKHESKIKTCTEIVLKLELFSLYFFHKEYNVQYTSNQNNYIIIFSRLKKQQIN